MGEGGPEDASLLPEPGRLARRWLRAFWLSILAAYALLFLLGWGRVGLEDHDQQLVFHEIQAWNQELFGLDRQWTPVMGGGMSAAGDPQIPVLSPAAVASYALGPFWGLRLATVLWFGVGFLAAFLYAGLWLRRREARALAAALFIGNGFFVCRFAYGHIPLLPFLAFPLLLWALHRAEPWARAVTGPRRAARRLCAALGFGGLLALQLDGSAQGLVYMLPWIGVYAFALAVVRRRVAPLALFVAGLGIAALLAAGFLWSLVDSQHINPRLRPDQFTNPLALLFFLVVPFRGNVPFLPTPANGYELSVFVGAIVAWALVRHGRSAWAGLPRELRVPLLLTGVASLLFGMGSLRSLGVPAFLSPFDLLRELPGFRSIGVTARAWGFLALPLAVLGAAALWRLACAVRNVHVLGILMLAALGLQLGFQAGTVGPKLMRSRAYEAVSTAGLFRGEGERVRYVTTREGEYQGQRITPVTGVINCYNMVDFIRPAMTEGDVLVARVTQGTVELDGAHFEGRFRTWSRIHLRRVGPWPGAAAAAATAPVRFVLRQAWHPYWALPGGRLERHAEGNLVAVVSRADLEDGGVELVFHDAVSALGTRVSTLAWPIAILLLLLLAPWLRAARPGARP